MTFWLFLSMHFSLNNDCNYLNLISGDGGGGTGGEGGPETGPTGPPPPVTTVGPHGSKFISCVNVFHNTVLPLLYSPIQ